MGCPICNKGEMEKIKDAIKQGGVEFEAFKCRTCSEEIMDMKQLRVLAGRYRKMSGAKEITFAKWGIALL
ncbi:hypothetical protein HYV89_00235 [Candidatus Woesearchaeota archaeon]|nr:hypothetical protein [Candidatus Woesearchaeota archaeon]